jgi:hypothetical protein
MPSSVAITMHESRLRWTALTLVVVLIGCATHETSALERDAGEDAGDAATGGVDAAILWSVDGGAMPSLTAEMRACTRKAECVDSPAAVSIKHIRCMIEVYCLEGMCHADCMTSCETVRDDENSCAEPKLCIPFPFSPRSYCSALPIACTSADACPEFRPKQADGSQSAWTCEGDICSYPGYDYAAQ